MAVWLLKNYIAPYSNQVSHHPNPLSSKSLIIQVPHWPNHVPPLSTNLGFSSLVLSPGWKVFLSMISMIFRFSSHISSSSSEIFHQLIPVSCFPPQSLSLGWKVFTNDIILLRLISFPMGLGCSHLSPGFLLSSTSLVGRFFTRFPFKVPIQNSYSRFPFKVLIVGFPFQVPFKVPLQQIPRSAELVSEKGGNCNNVTFKVEVIWQLPIIASSHPVWLLSTLGFSLSTPLSRRYDSSSSMPLSRWYVYLQVGKVFR